MSAIVARSFVTLSKLYWTMNTTFKKRLSGVFSINTHVIVPSFSLCSSTLKAREPIGIIPSISNY